jgi:predicted Zn-dependent protease
MIAGAIAGGGGKASEAAVSLGMASAESMMLKYTREIETEADHNGIHLMARAGYDPQAMVNFLKRMERYSTANAPKFPAYLLDHPTLESRVTLLENILTIEPKPARIFYGAGNYKRIQMRALIEESDPSGAVSHFESILRANPDDLETLFGLGVAFRRAGRLDKSAEILQTAFLANPKDTDLRKELGAVYFLAGKLDQAIETFEPMSQESDLMSLYYLGRAYQEKGAFDQALKLYLKVRSEMGDFVDLYFNLGSVYGRMGQKGLSHFAFGKYFELRGDRNTALLHYRTALDFLERGVPEREETQRMLRDLTQTK